MKKFIMLIATTILSGISGSAFAADPTVFCSAYCGKLVQTGETTEWSLFKGPHRNSDVLGHTTVTRQYSSEAIQSSRLVVATGPAVTALRDLSEQCSHEGELLFQTLAQGRPVPAMNALDMCSIVR